MFPTLKSMLIVLPGWVLDWTCKPCFGCSRFTSQRAFHQEGNYQNGFWRINDGDIQRIVLCTNIEGGFWWHKIIICLVSCNFWILCDHLRNCCLICKNIPKVFYCFLGWNLYREILGTSSWLCHIILECNHLAGHLYTIHILQYVLVCH